jgi:hypothetical protein
MKTFYGKRNLYFYYILSAASFFAARIRQPDNLTILVAQLIYFSSPPTILGKIHFGLFHDSHLLFSLFCLFTVTTISTPVSEITTLSLQSNTNAPSHPATSSSLPDIDVTAAPSDRRGDDSLKVLPLNTNKTDSSNDKDDPVTMTPSTQSPMTVNSFDTEIKPELTRNGETMEKIVNNDGDNHQANQPQKELVERDEIDEKSRLNQENPKEGRAINFPLGALQTLGGNENSTTPGHMSSSINFVTTSTEKTPVVDFFDLSDVSMDHELFEKKDGKGTKTTTEKQQTAGLEVEVKCSHNATTYKVS